MDDKRNANFEILDLGPAYDKGEEADDDPAQDGAAQPAVVIDLGDGTAASAPSPTLPRWQRWAIIAAVFVAGIAAGGYGWYASSQATDASRVELLVVELNREWSDPFEQSRFFARVHNAGRHEVTVLNLRFPDSPDSAEGPRQELAIPAGESVRGAVGGAPSCEAGVPQWLEADVQTDIGVSTVPIPLPGTYWTGSLVAMACGAPYPFAPDDSGVYLIEDASHAAIQASPFPMRLEMQRAVGRAEVLDMTARAPGFAAQATNLPISLEQGNPRPVRLIWTITDCPATRDLGSVDVELLLADGGPVTTRLPTWAIAQLAGFAARECGT